MTSPANGRSFRNGKLEIPTLDFIRTEVCDEAPPSNANLRISEAVADVQELHQQPDNAFAYLQVASQFHVA